jgi:hypothetical protein
MSAQPGAGQDDYNPFTDEGIKEKEPEVKRSSTYMYHFYMNVAGTMPI